METDTEIKHTPSKRALYTVRGILLFIYAFILFAAYQCVIELKKWVDNAPIENHFKTCYVEFGSGVILEGTRYFQYPALHILGFKIVATGKVSESTSVKIRGEPVTIIGQNGEEWYSKRIARHEMFDQLLVPTDNLTFIYGQEQEVAIVQYDDFCK